MHGPFQFGQGADIPGGHLKVSVFLKPLGGDHIPEQIDPVKLRIIFGSFRLILQMKIGFHAILF